MNTLIKRITSSSRASRSLNSTASQILSIYRSNLFVERTIDRIIFGPPSLSINFTDFNNGSDSETFEGEQEDEIVTEPSKAKQETESNTTKNEYSWITELLRDDATLRILSIYDRAKLSFVRNGVDLNPFELLAAQFYKNGQSIADGFRPLRMNSLLSFYQNNSLERFDLWTGKDQPGRQARLLKWDNQR